MGELKPSGLHQDSAATTSSLLPPNPACPAGKSSPTPELAAEPNSPTSTGFSQTSAASTRLQKLSPLSEADSTNSGKSCKPYWDKFCQEMSQWLSLPTKTDWREEANTCFDGSVSQTGVNSWFSTKQVSVGSEKWLRISSPYSTATASRKQATVPDSTDSENTKLRSRKSGFTQARNSIKPGGNGSQPAGTATTRLSPYSTVASA